jgi:hypothetical protein
MVLALLASPLSARAASVTFQFSGLVTDVFGSVFTPGGTGSNGFSTGLPLSGSYTFNSSTPDSGGGANNGRYNNAVQNLSVTVGGYTATFTPGSSFIQVINRPSGDSYEVRADGLLGNAVNGRIPTSFRFELTDPSGSVFSNDSLPTTPPSLSSFASSQWRLIFEATGRRVQGALSSVVPLPAAVWLFGAGLIALVGLGSRSLVMRKDPQI